MAAVDVEDVVDVEVVVDVAVNETENGKNDVINNCDNDCGKAWKMLLYI